MILTSTLLSALLALTTPRVVRRMAPEARRRWWWIAIPTAAAMAGVLSWSAMRVRGDSWPMVVAMAIVAAVLSMQNVIDLAVRRLPRMLSHYALIVFLIGAAIHPAGTTSGFRSALVGAVVLTLITVVLMGISRGSLGMGDVHLSPLLGAVVGWFDPAAVFTMWLATAIFGACIIVVGMATKRLDRRSVIPYGPPMMLGMLVAVLIVAVR